MSKTERFISVSEEILKIDSRRRQEVRNVVSIEEGAVLRGENGVGFVEMRA